MKTTKKYLQKIIKEEVENIISEFDIKSFTLRPLKGPKILQFNAGQPAHRAAAAAEVSKFLQKTPFKFKEVWTGLKPGSEFMAPTHEEHKVFIKLTKELVRSFRSKGVKEEDMNVTFPIILVSSDVSKFPGGEWQVVQWGNPQYGMPGREIADVLMDPRYNLPQKKQFQRKEKSGGGARWFVPIAKKNREIDNEDKNS